MDWKEIALIVLGLISGYLFFKGRKEKSRLMRLVIKKGEDNVKKLEKRVKSARDRFYDLLKRYRKK